MSWPESPMSAAPSMDVVEFPSQNPPLPFLLGALILDILGLVCTVMLGSSGDIAGYVLALLAFVALLGFRHFDGKARETSYVREIFGLEAGVRCLLVLTIVLMTISMWPIATEISRKF